MSAHQMSQQLINKRVFVTGGSRGIGASIVRELAARGAIVGFSYSSRKESAEALLGEIQKEFPGNHEGKKHCCFQMDVASETSVDTTMGQLLEFWGGIDGLVNNAGITKDNLLLRMKSEEFDQVINTNLRGTFLASRSVAKPMMRARAGSIVNITSVIGQTGNAGQANYAASKAGTEAFSKSMAKEFASRNVRINCIAPGFIATEMTDVLPQEHKDAIIKNIPLGRIANPKEVAAVVAFLISNDASYITGHTLSVNGGMAMI